VAEYVFTAVWHANYKELIGYPTTTEAPSPEPTGSSSLYVPVGGGPMQELNCLCTTTIDGEEHVTHAPPTDGKCNKYTTWPSIPVTTTEAPAPTAEAPVVDEPYTSTTFGTVLVWNSYSLLSFRYAPWGIATITVGLGASSTIATPFPSQTASDTHGEPLCDTGHDGFKEILKNACDEAFSQLNDDEIFTTSKKMEVPVDFPGIHWDDGTLGTCVAEFKCSDYGIGMSGKGIKQA
jgi:hypothetical protein